MDLTTLNVGGQSFIISMFVWPFSGSPQGLFFASKWRKIFKLDLSHWIYQKLSYFKNKWNENCGFSQPSLMWVSDQILKLFAIRLTSLTLGYYFKVKWYWIWQFQCIFAGKVYTLLHSKFPFLKNMHQQLVVSFVYFWSF